MRTRVPKADENLEVLASVRLFREHVTEMDYWMKKHKGRWANHSHMIRAALMVLFQRLDEEQVRREYMKRRLKVKL